MKTNRIIFSDGHLLKALSCAALHNVSFHCEIKSPGILCCSHVLGLLSIHHSPPLHIHSVRYQKLICYSCNSSQGHWGGRFKPFCSFPLCFIKSGLAGNHFEGSASHGLHGRPTCLGEDAGEDEVGRGKVFNCSQETGRLGQRCWSADQFDQNESVCAGY